MVNSPGNKAAKQARSLVAKQFPVPLIVSVPRRTALVLGSAKCLEIDKAAALALFKPTFIIACNEAGRDYEGEFDCWCSMHPDKLANWVKERRKAGRPDAKELWTPRNRTPPRSIVTREVPSWGGSSGLLCVTVALLGKECHKIVLAGVPMTVDQAHYFDPKPFSDALTYHSSWHRYLQLMHGKVKSMSGWTRQLLGAPDRDWFNA